MAYGSFTWIAAVLVTLASLATLLTEDWRASVGLLAVQYACAVFLIGSEWPPALSISALTAGWLAASILGMAMLSLPSGTREVVIPQINPFFNLLAAGLILLLVVSFAPQIPGWLPSLSVEQSWAALVLLGLGLLRLAFDPNPISTSTALLSILLGFELLFAGLSSSHLAIWLLAVVTLGIALSGAYMALAPSIEEKN